MTTNKPTDEKDTVKTTPTKASGNDSALAETADATPVENVVAEGQPASDTVDSTIKSYVIASMTVGLVPLPMADILGLMAIHLKMVDSLGRHHGVPFSVEKARPLILPLVAGALPVTVTFLAASMIKAMPGFGSLAGGATNAVTGGAITYAVGQVFSHHFARGGTLEDFDPIGLRERFRREMKDGEAVASDLQAQPTGS